MTALIRELPGESRMAIPRLAGQQSRSPLASPSRSLLASPIPWAVPAYPSRLPLGLPIR